jgi:hypothetical protein
MSWWVPTVEWLVTGVEHVGDDVLVRMGHPDWPHPLFIRAPDEETAVAWAMLRRNGVVQRKRRDPAKPSNTLPPSLREGSPGCKSPSVRVDLATGFVLRLPSSAERNGV